MHKQLITWQLIASSLQQNIAVMMLYVLESNGSSPGRQGFCMAVNANGEMQGSIGGGIMEHKFVEMAKQMADDGWRMAHKNQQGTGLRKQIHDKTAAKNQSGMICSGNQTILMYLVKKEDETTIKNIIVCLEKNRNGLLKFTPEHLFFDANYLPNKDFFFKQYSEDDWLYEEKLGIKNKLFIIGGGHCSLALSRLFSTMDFYIELFDERDELNTLESNNYVHKKHIVENYEALAGIELQGNNNYVVIMTVGYRTDNIVLKTLINKPFKYIGMLGSSKKIETLYADLKKEGFSDEKINKIYSPIGIQIHSQTPEEIAVSIAAEIIQLKNNPNMD